MGELAQNVQKAGRGLEQEVKETSQRTMGEHQYVDNLTRANGKTET